MSLVMNSKVNFRPCEQCGTRFKPIANSKSGRFCSSDCYRDFGRSDAGTARRLWEKVSKTDGCWLYTGGKGRNGYGLFYIHDRTVPAHKVAFELCCGPVPDGLFVCHSCDTPSCVRPDHLFLGTPKQNSEDMVQKGRHKGQEPGEGHKLSKLTEADVLLIRSDPRGPSDLAAQFGVSAPTICDIRSRRSWRHI